MSIWSPSGSRTSSPESRAPSPDDFRAVTTRNTPGEPEHHCARDPQQHGRSKRWLDVARQLGVAQEDHCPADERQHHHLRDAAGDDHLHWRAQEPVERPAPPTGTPRSVAPGRRRAASSRPYAPATRAKSAKMRE